jgi:hypothetical protein
MVARVLKQSHAIVVYHAPVTASTAHRTNMRLRSVKTPGGAVVNTIFRIYRSHTQREELIIHTE